VFFEEVELFKVAVEVGADVVPGVVGVVDLRGRIRLSEVEEAGEAGGKKGKNRGKRWKCNEDVGVEKQRGLGGGEKEKTYLLVSPCIRQLDLPILLDLSKRVQDVGKVVSGNVFGLEGAPVDPPVGEVSDAVDGGGSVRVRGKIAGGLKR
jgi:hypothetical protein